MHAHPAATPNNPASGERSVRQRTTRGLCCSRSLPCRLRGHLGVTFSHVGGSGPSGHPPPGHTKDAGKGPDGREADGRARTGREDGPGAGGGRESEPTATAPRRGDRRPAGSVNWEPSYPSCRERGQAGREGRTSSTSGAPGREWRAREETVNVPHAQELREARE